MRNTESQEELYAPFGAIHTPSHLALGRNARAMWEVALGAEPLSRISQMTPEDTVLRDQLPSSRQQNHKHDTSFYVSDA